MQFLIEKNMLLWLKSANAFFKIFNYQVVNESKPLGSVQSSRLPRNKMQYLPSGLNQMESQILMPTSNIFGCFPLLQKLVLSTLFCIIQISLSLAGKVWPNVLVSERRIQGRDIPETAKVFPRYIQFYALISNADPSLGHLF